MLVHPLKKELNTWQCYFYFGHDFQRMELGWKRFEFAFMNIHTFPEQGEMLQRKKHFKGFLFKFFIWLPIDF